MGNIDYDALDDLQVDFPISFLGHRLDKFLMNRENSENERDKITHELAEHESFNTTDVEVILLSLPEFLFWDSEIIFK